MIPDGCRPFRERFVGQFRMPYEGPDAGRGLGRYRVPGCAELGRLANAVGSRESRQGGRWTDKQGRMRCDTRGLPS